MQYELKVRLFILFLLGITTGISARENLKDTAPAKVAKDTIYNFRRVAHETLLFAEAPAKWHKTDWLTFGIVIAGTAAIMPFDQPITKLAMGHQRFYYSIPVVGGRVYGEWYTITGITAVFAGYGIITHNITAKKISMELFQAGIYSAVITEILKTGIGRARPYNGLGAFDYRPFSFADYSFNSSPSGHATTAFALSTVLFRNAHSTWLKILSFVPAGFTVFSRVYQLQHWSSDEFFGSAIGFTTGMWVVNLHEPKKHIVLNN